MKLFSPTILLALFCSAAQCAPVVIANADNADISYLVEKRAGVLCNGQLCTRDPKFGGGNGGGGGGGGDFDFNNGGGGGSDPLNRRAITARTDLGDGTGDGDTGGGTGGGNGLTGGASPSSAKTKLTGTDFLGDFLQSLRDAFEQYLKDGGFDFSDFLKS
ncbi:hypothetical protein ABW21_db0209494 [Orbilia brochopaga]|nr:hypothetical protein ABW21_db0209494 [Drechslerella brochopaga]